MAKNSNVLLLAGVGVIAWWLYRKASAAGNLVFSPGNVTAMDFVDLNPTITFTIYAQNTSGTDLQLNSLAANITSNGSLIGNVGNFLPQIIPGNSNTPIQLTGSLQILGIVNDVIRAFQYKNIQQQLELVGAVNVNGIQAPLSLKFTVG